MKKLEVKVAVWDGTEFQFNVGAGQHQVVVCVMTWPRASDLCSLHKRTVTLNLPMLGTLLLCHSRALVTDTISQDLRETNFEKDSIYQYSQSVTSRILRPSPLE